MMTVLNRKEEMKELALHFQVELLVVVGSFGTDSYRSGESDIDVAYLRSKPLSVRDSITIIKELSRLFENSKIDLIDLQRASGLLKYEAASKGRVLYEIREGFFERYKLFCLRYYYDTKKFRDQRSTYLQERIEVLKSDKK
jgi:uncharacterized protein